MNVEWTVFSNTALGRVFLNNPKPTGRWKLVTGGDSALIYLEFEYTAGVFRKRTETEFFPEIDLWYRIHGDIQECGK